MLPCQQRRPCVLARLLRYSRKRLWPPRHFSTFRAVTFNQPLPIARLAYTNTISSRWYQDHSVDWPLYIRKFYFIAFTAPTNSKVGESRQASIIGLGNGALDLSHGCSWVLHSLTWRLNFHTHHCHCAVTYMLFILYVSSKSFSFWCIYGCGACW